MTAYKELSHILEHLGVEVRINSREKCDLIHIHSVGPYARYWAKKSRSPLVITAHTAPGELKYLFKLGIIVEKASTYYLRNLYNMADVVIAPTNFTKQVLENLKITKPIEVISNGVNLEKFKFDTVKRHEFRERYNILPDEKVIYSVGVRSSRKGLDKFLAIAKKMQHYKFLWIGRSPWAIAKNSFSDSILIKKAPKNFIKTGYVDDVVGAHCAGDVFLFPSPFETQGISALEAAACSRPIIVENIPSFEWVGKSCLKAKTIDDYCAQIEEALNHYKKYQEYSDNLAKQNDVIRTGKAMIRLYENVLMTYK